MIDYTKISVVELRHMLMDLGVAEEEADAIKGKGNLIERHKLLTNSINDEPILSDIEPTVEQSTVTNLPTAITDAGWTDYVMGLLTEDEKINQNPTTDGLRRITELLIGTILESTSEVLQVPTPDNEKRATVKHRVVVDNGNNVLVSEGCADVFKGNTPPEFVNHAVATAETRAEGRALRRLLKLRKIITSDESSGNYDNETNTKITDEQISFIETVTKAKNICLLKLTQLVIGNPTVDIHKLSFEQADGLVEQLSRFANSGREVPENLLKLQEKVDASNI